MHQPSGLNQDGRPSGRPWGPAAAGGPRQWQGGARVLLAVILFALGLHVLSNYLPALAWAVVLAIALWPLYERARRLVPPWATEKLLPIAFTLLVGFVFLLPFVAFTIEAVRELHDAVDYGRQIEQSGIPVPDFVAHLPFGVQPISDWWNAHLAHAGWASEYLKQINTSSNRELGRTFGLEVVHRVVIFGFCLLTLFFLFKDGRTVLRQCVVGSEKLFGARGERIALQMVASIHGTVNGLVFVGIGEGVLLGIVYFLTGTPHPILFGAFTAVAAMIPFAASVAIGLAALVLLGGGHVVPAIIVVVAGLVVVFSADHFVRPALIGGATKLPFLWVLLGILGGVETFRLLGLFVGPAIMAALILIWRDFTADEDGSRISAEISNDS